jgi:hypothetical protein
MLSQTIFFYIKIVHEIGCDNNYTINQPHSIQSFVNEKTIQPHLQLVINLLYLDT